MARLGSMRPRPEQKKISKSPLVEVLQLAPVEAPPPVEALVEAPVELELAHPHPHRKVTGRTRAGEVAEEAEAPEGAEVEEGVGQGVPPSPSGMRPTRGHGCSSSIPW